MNQAKMTKQEQAQARADFADHVYASSEPHEGLHLCSNLDDEKAFLRDDLRDDGQAYGGLGESYSSRNS